MRIAFLYSGGVDSSVALHKLMQEGHDVTAFYLKIWLEDELSYLGDCPWQDDLSFIKETCSMLSVPLEIVSLQKEYWDRVVSYTIDSIKKGLTPNPDMMCNTMIKFGAFYEKYGFLYDAVGSGHYGAMEQYEGEKRLKIAADKKKDQTYFLAYTPYEFLQKAVFPLADMHKADVRLYASKYNLPSAQRKDSQGICFLGKIPFKNFVEHYCGKKVGNIIEYETQKIVGTHEGLWFYTIGQRSGIRLSGGPWYVYQKDYQENILYISRHYYDQSKERKIVNVHSINWLTKKKFAQGEKVKIKLRHGEMYHEGIVDLCNYENGCYRFILKDNDQGIASGQFAVLYDDKDYVWGAGIIV